MNKLYKYLLVLIFISCNNEKKNLYGETVLLGNWSSYKEGSYMEYFITKNNIYLYLSNSGDIFEYHYLFRNDSIFTCLNYPYLEQEGYRFYDKLIDSTSGKLLLKTQVWRKFEDKNTLQDLVTRKIVKEIYENASYERERGYSFQEN